MDTLEFLEKPALRRNRAFVAIGADELTSVLLEQVLIHEYPGTSNPQVRRLDLREEADTNSVLSLSQGRMLMARDTLFIVQKAEKLSTDGVSKVLKNCLQNEEPRFRFLIHLQKSLDEVPSEACIQSRPWSYNNHPKGGQDLFRALKWWCDTKGFQLPSKVVGAITSACLESPLDALQYIKAADLLEGDFEAIQSMLPNPERTDLFELMEAIYSGDLPKTLKCLKPMETGPDRSHLLQGVLREVRLLLSLHHMIPKEERSVFLRQAQTASQGYQKEKRKTRHQELRQSVLKHCPAGLRQELQARLRSDYRLRKLILSLAIIPESELRDLYQMTLEKLYTERRMGLEKHSERLPVYLLEAAQRQHLRRTNRLHTRETHNLSR